MKRNLIKLILLFFVSMLTVGAWGTPDKGYLCITAEKAGATVQLVKDGSPADVSLQYSTDCGKWDNYTIGTEITLTNVGDKVYFRNANEAKDVAGFSNGLGYYSFAFSDSVSVCGNIMSLVDNNVERASVPCDSCFQRLFLGCTTLTSAADLKLPATTLTDYCYYYMFYGCTSLISAPELPATELAVACYCAMFGECTALETVPELQATKLAMYCYYSMFGDCSSLETAPELRATKLAYGCYTEMFRGCSSLETAPKLPATTLAEYCYYGMFSGCTALEIAPKLPATELKHGCYEDMFYGCKKLNSVKVDFTAWEEDKYATYRWLSGAGAEATPTPVFEYSADELDVTTRDDSHVPSGWTITRKPDYLCFTAETSSTSVWLYKQGSPTPVTIEYSTDEGANWTTVDFSSAMHTKQRTWRDSLMTKAIIISISLAMYL